MSKSYMKFTPGYTHQILMVIFILVPFKIESFNKKNYKKYCFWNTI